MLVFDRTFNPGQLSIVREIVDGGQEGDIDTAVYTDVIANYTITKNADGTITVDHTSFDPANAPDVGDGEEGVFDPIIRSDGRDTLRNIEMLQFLDQTVNVREFFAQPLLRIVQAAGAQLLASTVDGSPLAAELSLQWQVMDANGVWVPVAGATGATFTPPNALRGQEIRVIGLSGDDMLVTVNTAYVSTGVADDFTASERANLILGLGGDDDLEGGGNDELTGGHGNDLLIGGGTAPLSSSLASTATR